jgi:hypothetical protein
MERILLVLAIVAIIAFGLLAGVAGLFVGNGAGSDNWSPREYVVARPGDCFVPPQGDPLYDEHYAKNVNTYNCKALIDQSKSKNIDADTGATNWQTNQSRLSTAALIALGLAIVGFFVYVATR